MKPLFVLSNIKKTYPSEKNAALDIEKLAIPKNALVAVVGYSGSGKTTLLNILGLLDLPDESKNKPEILYFNNHDIPVNTCNIKDANKFRRKNFGFIFQQGYLISNLTCRANIEIPMHINGFKVDEEKINELLQLAGITDQDSRQPSEISGGESQKIAFVRSIVHTPNVILADEPTSNLDQDIGFQLIDFLKRLCKKEKSVIWITHNIHQAVAFADYIIVLKNGIAQGPITNPKNPEKILNLLLQNKDNEYRKEGFSPQEPEKVDNPILNVFIFLISFAWSDIFPRTKNIFKGILPALVGRRNTQLLNIISLFLVICLSALLLNISYAFKNYFILSVSDPLINKIIVKKKIRGSQTLTEYDIEDLSSLMWAYPKGISSTPLVAWPEKIKKQKLIEIRKATMGAFGIYRGSMDCFMNPDSNASTMSGRVGISMAAVNVHDPILSKIYLINLFGDKKLVKSVFIENNKVIQDKEGIIISQIALKKHLDYKNIPKYLKIDHQKAQIKKIPILGVAERLPYNVDILVTEGWYLQQYWKLGKNDPKPAYYHISIYVQDKIRDGLPVCHALEEMGYTGIGNIKNKLHWISNMTDIIFIFIGCVILGICFLVFSLLWISFANALKNKQKEMGILMAKGMKKIQLYFIFWFEIFIVWLISILFAYPTYCIVLNVIKKFIEYKFQAQQLNIQGIFEIPDILWPMVILISLCLAFVAVFWGIRGVLKQNLASILRYGD